MERVKGAPCSKVDKDLVSKWSILSCCALGLSVRSKAYRNWPVDPTTAVHLDPDEKGSSEEDPRKVLQEVPHKGEAKYKERAGGDGAVYQSVRCLESQRRALMAAI